MPYLPNVIGTAEFAALRDANLQRKCQEIAARLDYYGSRQEKIDRRNASVRKQIKEIQRIWDDIQMCRKRSEVIAYLDAILRIYKKASRKNRTGLLISVAREWLDGNADEEIDVFRALVRATADPKQIDCKRESKYVRVLRYAARHKRDDVKFSDFMTDRGGINGICRLYASSMRRAVRSRQ